MAEYKKIVLAYSGGLDTSVIIPWLKENYGDPEIIAVSADVGQGAELDGLEEKALKTGASKLYIEDLTDEFVDEYIVPTVKAGAKYESYLLGTAFARPVIAKRIVEIALQEGADAIAHGCTGKGNDQVRFELTIKAFAPQMKIIAPWREWELKSRDDEIDYAEAHDIPLKISRETNYSKDKNLWHLSHEGLDLENPGNEPLYRKSGFLEMSVAPEDAPDKPEYVEIAFDCGVPVALDGKTMSAKNIIYALNETGGRNGVGLLDIVENRLVGMKSRGVYETPGGTILMHAHDVLETVTLDKETSHLKAQLALKFAELVYNGLWFTPVREALSAFFDKTQETVTGKVRLKLYKGNVVNAGVWSEYSLYSEELASFGESDYDQRESEGFINLFGLPVKVKAILDAQKREKVFLFDDIAKLSDPVVQRILRDVDTKELALSLKVAPEKVRDKVKNNVSTSLWEIIAEEMKLTGPVRVSDVDAAQQRIINTVKKLAADGEIMYPEGMIPESGLREFVFDNIIMLPDTALQIVLNEINAEEMALALKATVIPFDIIASRINAQYMSRVREVVLPENVEFSNILDAQLRIVKIIKKLAADGKILLPRGYR